LFSDRTLSASGLQSCATCHNPNDAHAQANDLAVQLGGSNLLQTGVRAPPSLNYQYPRPPRSLDAAGRPTAGFDRDGRAASIALQAQEPLLAPFEMANAGVSAVVVRLAKASYAAEFRAVFGPHALDDPGAAFARMSYALQRYQIEAPEFHPYTSKFDRYLQGKAMLTRAEMHGLALFNDPRKGNCAACHPSAPAANGRPPLFTNFRYAVLGVPRNQAIPANNPASYFDLGVCGPYRLDLSDRRDLCGAFKVPTLRNVSTRKVFFHNGRFRDLKTAVTFLVQRDTNPSAWYPLDQAGSARKFDDIPPGLQGSVDTLDAPFNRRFGEAPALSSDEIADLVRFLGTLTDGYTSGQSS
jgi:cytochrome c peroxidase